MSRDIASKHTGLESFDVTTDIRFRCNEVTFVHIAMGFLVLIRHNDATAIRFNLMVKRINTLFEQIKDMKAYHEQRLAQRATTLPQDLIRAQGDDVTQREDERMHVFHVEVIRCNGIGD